jgi:hypothetical protein
LAFALKILGFSFSTLSRIFVKLLTAKEEDILTSVNLIRKGIQIDKMLESIIVEPGVNINDLSVGDKNAILVTSRILAFGPDYQAKINDPFDNEEIEITIDLSQIVKPLKTAEIKTSGDLALSDDNIIKVFKGTKVIINKTAKFDSGVYTVGGVQQVEIKYLGKAAVVGNSVVITNEETGKSFVRSKDDFAKAEGFKNWSEFEKNNPTASNFIKGTQGRFIYEVKPAGNISAETGAGQSIDPAYNSVIKAFNDKLIASNGVLPKEFIHQEGNVPQKYLLTKNNLYNLVDIDTGSIYLRNINLQTGEIVNEDLPSVAVDKQRVKSFIDRVNKDIKNFKVDVVLAEKNVDVQDILDAAENANTENDLDAVISKYNKNIC